jgi:putative transposase
MEAEFCIEALREALARWGSLEIVKTDRGSQFSNTEFVAEFQRVGALQSMDGKGCWRDNVFVERLWRSVKYEDVHLKAYNGVSATRQSLAMSFVSTTPAGRTRASTGVHRKWSTANRCGR